MASKKFVPSHVQIQFLKNAQEKQLTLTIFIRSQLEELKGILLEFDDYSLLLRDSNDKIFIVFKSDICAISCSDELTLTKSRFPFDGHEREQDIHNRYLIHAAKNNTKLQVTLSNNAVYSGDIAYVDLYVLVMHIENQYILIYKGSLRKIEMLD